MKLKKLLAAVTAAALAVTTMAVTSFTASAAEDAYINLKGNTTNYALNVNYDCKTAITAGTNTYALSCTSGSYEDTLAALDINFYGSKEKLKDVSLESVTVNGTDKGVSSTTASEEEWLYDGTDQSSKHGFKITLSAAQLEAIGTIPAEATIVFNVKATYDDSVKTIDASNFTCSKTAGELEIGDSFTITYDSSNTPDTAKWVVKCSFDEDFADAGITSRWPQLVNADGTVDNNASADTGLEVAKTAEGVYTFTAVNASKAGYVINVEASAAGDFSDTQYLGQGGSGKWSVAAATEPTYTIDPDTATIKVGESKVFTLKGYEGTEPLIWSIDTDFADMQLDGELTRHQVKIVGLAKSNGPLTLTIKKSESEILATANVTIVEADAPPAAETVEIAFPTGVIELKVKENEWDGQNPHGLMAQADINASGESIGKTFAELKTGKLKLTGVKFDNCSVDGITAGDVKATLFTQWTGWKWKPAAEAALNSESIEFDLSTITGVEDTDELLAYGVQITINDNSKLTGLAVDDIVKINDAGTNPPTPPVTTDAIWEGNTDMGTDWSASVQIPAAKFAEIKVGDTLKYTFTCEDDAQMKIASMTEGWPVIPGPNPDPEWGIINISGTSFSFVLTAADVTTLKEFGMAVSGKNYTLTKVELVPKSEPKPPVTDPDHTHTPATAWTSDATGHWHACRDCTEKVDFAAHTSDGGNITTPATETTAGTKTYKCTVCDYVIKTETIPATGTGSTPAPWVPAPGVSAPVIPIGGATNTNSPSVNGKNGWEVVSAEIIVASDGDKIVVDMNGAEKVPSTILGDIEGKDVDVIFDMGRGIKWTINGLSVTSNKTINLDVTKNTRHIPDEVVDKAEGSHKKQISLDHKGSFGCVATLSYDVGTKYNGLYANLFYYNPKTEELEFTDCSLVSGGKANFMFTHASDYLITFSDEPLGEFEDVSSAAGITSENNDIGNGVAVSAVLAAIVLGFGIVVYKKRRHN